jgi:hypothetical protein
VSQQSRKLYWNSAVAAVPGLQQQGSIVILDCDKKSKNATDGRVNEIDSRSPIASAQLWDGINTADCCIVNTAQYTSFRYDAADRRRANAETLGGLP